MYAFQKWFLDFLSQKQRHPLERSDLLFYMLNMTNIKNYKSIFSIFYTYKSFIFLLLLFPTASRQREGGGANRSGLFQEDTQLANQSIRI
jgi:hypothetical protein